VSLDEHTRPRLVAGAVVSDLSDGEVVVASEDGQRALILNDTASVVVSLCTGQHTVEAIASLFADTLGVSRDDARADVLRLLGELDDEKLLAHG
jgi:hypothetical protein